MAIICTAFTGFFAWRAFDEMRKFDFYPFGSFGWGAVAFLCAVSWYTVAYHQRKHKLPIPVTWPVVEGYIAEVKENQRDDGFLDIALAYTYEVEGERYVGRESFSFAPDEDKMGLNNGCKEHIVKVHYRIDKPSVSVLDREDIRHC